MSGTGPEPSAPPTACESGVATRLANAEQRVEQLSRLLALAQDFGRIAIIERDIRTGEGRWSPRAYAFYGFDPSDATPSIDAAMGRIHPLDRERVRANLELGSKTTGRRETRFRIVHPGGEVRHVHALSESCGGADGVPRFMTTVLIDDTDEVVRQQDTGRENARLAATLEMTGVSVWRIDLDARRITFNDAGYRNLGFESSPRDLALEDVRDVAHPQDRADITAAAKAALESTAAVGLRARFMYPDGRYHTMMTQRVAQRDADGRARALLGISLDISAEVEERERANALALGMELISEAVGVGLWSLDLETGAVEWNAQMFRLYGLAPDAAAPQAANWMEELAHPDDRARVALERKRSRDAGEIDFETDFRIRQADGGWRWVACRSRRTMRDGRPMLFGIHLDIQKAKLAEQALRDKAAAEQASKAKSEFLAHMSHELRTPLNAVIGFSQLLAHDGADALSLLQRERAQRIEIAANHLLALIDDVLDLASIEAGSIAIAAEPVALDELLHGVVQWMEPLARRADVELRVEQRADGAVRADARRLRQVLTNLVSNAIKYNHRQGWVQLRTRRRRRGAIDGWDLIVADNGPGLSREQQRGLYEPFNRAGAEHGKVAGTGIGLTIAHRLVERMGGMLDVRSAVGAGCEFQVWMPRAEGGTEDATGGARGGMSLEPGAETRRPGRTLRVLCVEDDPTNLLLVQELVALRPAIVLRSAPDGATALGRALDDPPDVMLVDMHLPDFDGLEVLRRVREAPALARTVCIALSANAMAEDIARARAAGFDDYWTKPIAFDQFLAQLDALIDRRHPTQAACGAD